jgi:hypothetical protein
VWDAFQPKSVWRNKMDDEQKNIEVQIKVIKIMVLQLMVMAVVPFVNLFHFDRWIVFMVAAANPILAVIGFIIAFKRFKQRGKEEHGLSKL